MLPKLTDYTPPSTADMVDNTENKTAAKIKRLVESSNGVNTVLNEITNNSQSIVTGGSTLNVTQNTDTNIFCNTTSGNITINLPAISGNIKPYHIHLIADGFASGYTVTINVDGTDKMDNPWSPIAVPTATSYKLYIAGEGVHIFDDGTYWRAQAYCPSANYFALVGLTADTTIGGTGWQRVNLNREFTGGDVYSFYDNATNYRFTPKISGTYDIRANMSLSNATSITLGSAVYVNGAATSLTNETRETFTDSDNFVFNTSNIVTLNGSTDYVELRAYGDTNTSINAVHTKVYMVLRQRTS